MKKGIPPFKITCILGVGNPGEAYKNTYHNAGFRAIEALLKKEGLSDAPPRREKYFEWWKKDGRIIARSRTFMNESGAAAHALLKKCKAPPEQLLMVHDDSDLAVGKTQYAFGRGAAGHHGVLSVMERIGTKDFWRLRIGIRTTDEKAERFVLRKIRTQDTEALYRVLEAFTRKVTEKESP